MAYNILIVDDSSIIRQVIAKTLGLTKLETGEIWQAANGMEALEVIEKEWVDLVLVDINMPVMGGVEMIKKLKEKDMLQSIPVVIVSTEGSKTRIDELLGLGVRGYLRKPFSPEQLREAIETALEVKE